MVIDLPESFLDFLVDFIGLLNLSAESLGLLDFPVEPS